MLREVVVVVGVVVDSLSQTRSTPLWLTHTLQLDLAPRRIPRPPLPHTTPHPTRSQIPNHVHPWSLLDAAPATRYKTISI